MNEYKDRIDDLLRRILSKDSHLSYSSLKAFAKSPKDFIAYKFEDRSSTKAMDFGTLVHCKLFEPEKFEDKYTYLPDDAPKKPTITQINAKKPSEDTIKQIAWWAEFEEKNKGKVIVSRADQREAELLANNIKYNYASKKILDRCTQFEIPLEFDHNNFRFKGYIDGQGENIRMDLKIVADASVRKFQRTAIDMGYHIQAALYSIGGGDLPYYIVAADKSGCVSVHKITLDLLEYGKQQVNKILDDFNNCILTEGWDRSLDYYSLRADGSFEFDRPSFLY